MKLMHLSPSQNLSEDRIIIVIMQGSPTTSLFDLPGNTSHQDTSTTASPELQDVSVQAYIAFTIILILFLMTFLGNILIIASVAKFKRLQIPPNYILINMAVADMGVAIMTLVLYTFTYVRDVEDDSVMCLVPYCFMSLMSGVSVLSLSVIAYDRYSALVEPLKYSSRITSFRITVICVAVWLYVTFVSTIPLIGWFHPLPGSSMNMEKLCSLNFYNSYTLLAQVLAIFLPAVVCMFFCYCRVMLVARHHTRAISAVQFSLFPGVLKNYNSFKGNKYWRTLALILGVFTLTWGTFTISVVVEVFCQNCANFLQIHNYSGLLLLLNSSLNPWIYAYRNQDFRAAFSRILRCVTKPCEKKLSRSKSNLVGERRNSRMSVALSRTNSMCGNLQTLQMLYEQEMGLKNNNQPDFKDGEVETRNTSVNNSKVSVNNSKVSVNKDIEKEPEKTSPVVQQTIPEV